MNAYKSVEKLIKSQPTLAAALSSDIVKDPRQPSEGMNSRRIVLWGEERWIVAFSGYEDVFVIVEGLSPK